MTARRVFLIALPILTLFAIRAVAAYLREREATVSAFSLSNVEQYLRQGRGWNVFGANVATLPRGDSVRWLPGSTTVGSDDPRRSAS